MASERPQTEPAEDRASSPVRESSPVERAVAPVARAGWRATRGVARRLGLDRAAGAAVDRGVDRALESNTAARATERLLDTDTAKRVWDKVLESEEAQKLVERVAEAPEVRAAIASQGIGLVEDLRRVVRRVGRGADGLIENGLRRLLRRTPRQSRPIFAGILTRVMALAIDAGIVYGSLLLVSAALAALVSVIGNGHEHAGTVVVVTGAVVWALVAAVYFIVFWSGAGRTPGMSFVAIRMLSDDAEPVRGGQAVRRLIWMAVAALPLMLGYLGVVLDRERRGWPDRRAGTVVCYADPDLDKDLV